MCSGGAAKSLVGGLCDLRSGSDCSRETPALGSAEPRGSDISIYPHLRGDNVVGRKPAEGPGNDGKKLYLGGGGAYTCLHTTLPDLLRGMELLGMPAILVRVIQFLYRYLFVLVDQGYRMRQAALCRGNGWPSAAGALTVLFARSYGRAEAIQRSMLARGYCGHFPALSPLRFGAADWLFLAAGAAGPLALCVAGAYEASY